MSSLAHRPDIVDPSRGAPASALVNVGRGCSGVTPLRGLATPATILCALVLNAGTALAGPPRGSSGGGDPTAATPAPVDTSTTTQTPPGNCAPAGDEALAQAKALYEAGLIRYQVADFEAAIELWLAAYEKVPDEVGAGTIKAEIVYNVATAQERWYDVDQDITHLRKAKRSLEGFVAVIPAIYAEASIAEEREKADARIAELTTRIGKAEADARAFELAKAERMRAKFDPIVDERERIRNTGMIAAGATFSVLGGLSLAAMGTGIGLVSKAERDVAAADEWSELGPRRDALSLGAAGQQMAIIGGVAAGVFVATGVPLLAAGVVFEKKRRSYRSKYAVRVAPVFGRDGSGIVLSGRF
jgi:hypothetical protein